MLCNAGKVFFGFIYPLLKVGEHHQRPRMWVSGGVFRADFPQLGDVLL